MNKQIEEKFLTENAPALPQSAIAVLPSKIINTEKDCRKFLDLADSVIVNLSRNKQIIVRPTSASRLFDIPYDPTDVGFTLCVDYVVDSRVEQTGEQIRATAQLLRVLDGRLLWKEEYVKHSSDIALIESAISNQVMRTLGLHQGDESELSYLHHTNKPEIYRKFKLGRYFFNESRFRRAIWQFNKILEIDKNCVPAIVSLAQCYLFLGIYNDATSLKAVSPEAAPPEAFFALASKWARIAAEKDNSLADVHAVLGYTEMFKRNWSGAESEFLRALALSPNVTAHQGAAHLYTALRRFDEAQEEIEQALEIDPFSPLINLVKGFVLFYAGKHDESLEQFRYTVTLAPRSHAAHYGAALAASQQGEFESALQSTQKAIVYSNNDGQKRALKAYLLAMLGEKDKAQEELEKLNKEMAKSYVSPYHLAAIFTALGERDQAFSYLEKTLTIKDQWLVLLRDDPRFVTLHNDPKYNRLIQRIGFPPMRE
ncbi:MAG: tetratricopeptide repeat protein [Acidobacteriota bacterium]|nr:tetratricopeptide repeat protein [Acidobacteriota bacterium]